MGVDEYASLTRKAARGDTEAFCRLFYRSLPILRHLYAKWNGHCAEPDDFTQEVFLRLWRQREDFRGESSLLTYLLAIARYTLYEEARQSRKAARIHLETRPRYGEYSRNDLSQPEAEFHFQELSDFIEGAKANLTAEQRTSLEVHQTADVTLHEASKALGCSPKALECRLHRARKQLRTLLAPVLEDT